MSFTMQIMAREIAASISMCAQVVDAGSQIPILKATRISVMDGMASFMATNTDQTVVAKAACEGSGVVCIDTQALDAKVKTLKGDQIVNFKGDDKSVTVTQGRTRWVVPALLDDMPAYAEVDGAPVNVGEDFIKGLAQCLPAAETNDSRPYLMGAFLDGDRIVTTDGKQVRVFQHDATLVHKVTLPTRAAAKVASMFPGGASVRTSPNAMSFSTEVLTMKTKLVGGAYVDYRRVIPEGLPGSLQVLTADFIAALSRASAIRASGEKSGAFINAIMCIRESELEFRTRNNDGEEGSDTIEIERIGGADLDIAFKGEWLLAAVKSIDLPRVEILYRAARDPIVIRPYKGEFENIRLVMPRAF
jgi:DNA polymerase-3 subunit beta